MVDLPHKKRILLITSWFPADVGRRGLFNEFADAAVAAGAEIDVIAIDWRDVDQATNVTSVHQNAGMNVYRFKPLNIGGFGKFVSLIVKWIGTSLKAALTIIRLLRRNDYDVIVSHVPSAVWAPVLICILFSRSKKYLIQWDFVPYHQRAMGMMSNGITFQILLFLERALVRGFDVIGCMSEMNIVFLRKHYWIGKKQKVEILPIWTEAIFPKKPNRKKIRAQYGLPQDKKIAVFGGTLSKGRGLEDIIAAAHTVDERTSNILFLIVGRGPLEIEIGAMAEGLTNVKVMPAIPKHDYLKLLCACDCGVVATQRDTGVPTFPHKTLDYFRTGLPVVASVESSTDFGDFLEKQHAGIIVQAGDRSRLLSAVVAACNQKSKGVEMVANGKNLIADYFNVNNVLNRVLR